MIGNMRVQSLQQNMFYYSLCVAPGQSNTTTNRLKSISLKNIAFTLTDLSLRRNFFPHVDPISPGQHKLADVLFS